MKYTAITFQYSVQFGPDGHRNSFTESLGYIIERDDTMVRVTHKELPHVVELPIVAIKQGTPKPPEAKPAKKTSGGPPAGVA